MNAALTATQKERDRQKRQREKIIKGELRGKKGKEEKTEQVQGQSRGGV